MFIAHLPAGFLLTRFTRNRLPTVPVLLGSICPDFDMALIWLDLLHTNHHHFITHRPALWVAVLMGAFFFKSRWLTGLAIGAILHLMLDSFAGQINWFWPFGDLTLGLVEVVARPGWWALSFIRHWVFAVELVICALALAVIVWGRAKKNPRSHIVTRGSSNQFLDRH